MRDAEERIAALPEPIQKHVLPDDPYWCYVPDGWRDLVVELNEKLEEIKPDYVLHQVKEKFGGLRYYIDHVGLDDDTRDKLWDVISEYENKSFTVCDVSGKPGRPSVKRGYIRTRCEEHLDGGRFIED